MVTSLWFMWQGRLRERGKEIMPTNNSLIASSASWFSEQQERGLWWGMGDLSSQASLALPLMNCVTCGHDSNCSLPQFLRLTNDWEKQQPHTPSSKCCKIDLKYQLLKLQSSLCVQTYMDSVDVYSHLWDRLLLLPPFTDEATEVQKSWTCCSRSRSWKAVEQAAWLWNQF